MPESSSGGPLTSLQRRELFLRLAAAPEGVTAVDVYRQARELGDTASEEAYYNIARRLTHRALLVAQPRRGEPTRFTLGREGGDLWLQEGELAEIIDPEYPLLAITVWREHDARGRVAQAPLIRALATKGNLRPDLEAPEAADILWALAGPDLYRLLVVESAWSGDRYERWLAQSLSALLLGG